MTWREKVGKLYQPYIEVGEYVIEVPNPPQKKSEIENIDLPDLEQFFTYSKHSVNGKEFDVRGLSKIWNTVPSEIKEEIKAIEFERLQNGQWQMIKGQLFWIPPEQYFFCNYWDLDGKQPQWRHSNWDAMMLAHDSMIDLRTIGLFIIKGRRKAHSSMWNCVSYFRTISAQHADVGLVSKTFKDVKKNNFKKIIQAHNKMAPWVKPLSRSKRWAKEELSFAPEFDDDDPDDFIFGSIRVGPTTETSFDGEEMYHISMDEICKWEKCNPKNTLDVHKLCCTDGTGKVGFIMGYSSVEEIRPEFIKEVSRIWESAKQDPESKSFISANWFRRYFEPFWHGLGGHIDKWGFSLIESAIEWKDNEIKSLKKAKDISGLIEFMRKYPSNLDEALALSEGSGSFDTELIRYRMSNVKNLPPDEKPVRGNFEWRKPYEEAVFIPDDEGRWLMHGKVFGQHENNNIKRGNELYPGNPEHYCIGFDPYDHDDVDLSAHTNKRSSGGIVVRKKFDSELDGAKLDEYGRGNYKEPEEPYFKGEDFQSKRVCCTYLQRRETADLLYEDVAKTMVYYGSPVLFENNKQRFKEWLLNRFLSNFIMHRATVGSKSSVSLGQAGVPASETTKEEYFGYIEEDIYTNINNNYFMPLLEQLLKMNKKNATKNDLGVAYGLSLMAERVKTPRKRISEKEIVLWRPKVLSNAYRS